MVEADEYAGNFDAYRPDVIVLTTIEWDHPDVFQDREAVLDAFGSWARLAPAATIVANVADPGVDELLVGLGQRSGRVIRVAVRPADHGPDAPRDVDIRGGIESADSNGTTVRIDAGGAGEARVVLPTAGAHNVANALLVAAAALELGLSMDAVAAGLASFPGIGRRLERKGEARGVAVYDDYGHHPTAIRATIEAMRQREPGRRLWAVYEPLTFHRTAALLDDFATALAEADAVAVADIWASRDPDTTIASPDALVEAIRGRRPEMTAVAPGSVEDTAAWLAEHVAAGDAVLVMGGGRSYRIAELLLEALAPGRD